MDEKINLAGLDENKGLNRQLAELSELSSKKKPIDAGVSKLKGVKDIATSLGKKIHSVPPRQGNRGYLDLFLLQKERDRLVSEIALLRKRTVQLGIRVASIDQEMSERQEIARADITTLSDEPVLIQAESHGKPVRERVESEKQEAPKRYEYKEKEWNKLTLGY